MSKVFLYKELNTDDRDCVKYIDTTSISFSCGHYFSSINLVGSCFSEQLKMIDYKNIQTILTEAEIKELIEFNKEISNLGFGITQGDDRYKKGIKLYSGIGHIFTKLSSKANQRLFGKIISEEKSFLCKKFNISIEEIDIIFNEYCSDYKDRSIVSYVYSDKEELGIDTVELYTDLSSPNFIVNYIDYERLGSDIIDEDCSLYELEDGRIIRFSE